MEIGADGAVTVRAKDRRAADYAVPASHTAVSRRAYVPALNKIAVANAVSPALLEALVWQESRWHPQAVSPKGAIGLAQLMPGTAHALGVDPRDPLANLSGGARYLRQQLDRFGDLESALAAYNAGPARVIAARGVPAIPETRNFVDAIIARIAPVP
jgi:soluble lytic murein transglycosylase-like protein